MDVIPGTAPARSGCWWRAGARGPAPVAVAAWRWCVQPDWE